MSGFVRSSAANVCICTHESAGVLLSIRLLLTFSAVRVLRLGSRPLRRLILRLRNAQTVVNTG